VGERSAGTVLRTTDGGATWRRLALPADAAALDFRSVWAFDSLAAVVASAGEAAEGQARIYRTADGGRTWTLARRDTTRGVFYDAVAFWDREHGLVLSDPVDEGGRRRFVVLSTLDGGRTWARTPAAGHARRAPRRGRVRRRQRGARRRRHHARLVRHRRAGRRARLPSTTGGARLGRRPAPWRRGRRARALRRRRSRTPASASLPAATTAPRAPAAGSSPAPRTGSAGRAPT
jgi:hypothetical protein